ncbi:MAG: hypothetical protein NTV30_02445 [Chloroflexi bacterium]|nr:hypothetical protein [Chloroflexota bacterium]
MNDKIYKVLNPLSWFAPFDAVPLNPRLDTLKGKTIGIVGQHHEPMLFLKDALKAALPEAKDIIVLEKDKSYSGRMGITKAQMEDIKNRGINAIIQGIAH